MTRRQKVLQLFISMLRISSCTFGGGFVIMSLMKHRFCDELGWFTDEQMLDLTAMAQSAPGPIALNAAVLAGWRCSGFAGMVSAALGTVLPPLVILTVISLCYGAFAANPYVALALRGMQCGVAAVLTDVVLSLGEKIVRGRSPLHLLIMAAAFVCACVIRVNVMYIILCTALIGVAAAVIARMRREAEK